MAPQLFRDAFLTLCGIVEVGENAVSNLCSFVRRKRKVREHDPARGKTILITGGTSGVGFVVAKSLAARGAHVIITSRSSDRGEAAAQSIQSDAQGVPDSGQVSFMQLDLGSMACVRALSERVGALPDLDVLVCNAGLMCPVEHTLTEDGMEAQFQGRFRKGLAPARTYVNEILTNHLGHFVIAARTAAQHVKMAAQGQRKRPLRVVYLSSVAARSGNIHWDDLQGVRNYKPFKCYAQSKLACLMTAVELHDRCQASSRQHNLDDSTAVTCTAVHPGLVDTPLARYYFENSFLRPAFLRPVLRPLVRALFPIVLLKPELSIINMDFAMFGAGVERKYVRSNGAIGVFGEAESSEARSRLWDTSVELAGIPNPF